MRSDAAPAAGKRMEAGRRRTATKRARALSPAPVPADLESSWTDRLSIPLQAIAGPTRQLWLATLGGAALTVRGAAAVWATLITEGTAIEEALRARGLLIQRLGRFAAPPSPTDGE